MADMKEEKKQEGEVKKEGIYGVTDSHDGDEQDTNPIIKIGTDKFYRDVF